MSSNEYRLFLICVLFFTCISFSRVNAQYFTVSVTAYTAYQGNNVQFVATSSTLLTIANINWFANSVQITSSGVSSNTAKYIVVNNGTYFTLTIVNLTSSDFGYYTIAYFAASTQTVNITLGELTTIAPTTTTTTTITTTTTTVKPTTPNCESTSTTIAIFSLLIVGYIGLLISNILIFTITRTQRHKVECCDISMLVIWLQIALAFIITMIIVWITTVSITSTFSPLIASLFGLASYLSQWIGILYFTIMYIKEENLSYVKLYAMLGTILYQCGLFVGVIICVTYCGNVGVMPSISLDYGKLGIIFVCLLSSSSLYLMIWSIIFYKRQDLMSFSVLMAKKGRDTLTSPASLVPDANAKGGAKGIKSVPQSVSSVVSDRQKPQTSPYLSTLPRILQQFVLSIRRRVSKDNDFKNLVPTVAPVANKDAKNAADPKGGRRLSLKTNGLPLNSKTPRQNTMDTITKAGANKPEVSKSKDKAPTTNAKGTTTDNKQTQSKPQPIDNNKALIAQQQQQQANVGAKTQQLNINPGKGVEKKDSKSKKNKDEKDAVDPQVPGQVPVGEDSKLKLPKKKDKKKPKSRSKKRNSKKRTPTDSEPDDEFEINDDDDITEEDEENDDNENDNDNDDNSEQSDEDEDNDTDRDVNLSDEVDESEDSEIERKKRKAKKNKEGNKKSKKKRNK